MTFRLQRFFIVWLLSSACSWQQQKQQQQQQQQRHFALADSIPVEEPTCEFRLDEYRSVEEEPAFLIPKTLKPGEMVPIRWRKTLEPIDGENGETYVVGFPPELHQEVSSYVKDSGMLDLAWNLMYGEDAVRFDDAKIFTLKDGRKMGAMSPGHWNNDMVWLDPADEEAFESLVSVLRRGNFDVVMEALGKTFNLDGLMIQGIGAIFLSEYKKSRNIHADMIGIQGEFYNIIVPVHIPKNHSAHFYLCDADYQNDKAMTKLDPSIGIVLGGESFHGTGECSYRSVKDFRLSFSIYLADIKESNVDLIAEDDTSVWPAESETPWYMAQQHRFWSRTDPTKSFKHDTGRKSLTVKDIANDCTVDVCETDTHGKRNECAQTCRLFLNDQEYYSLIEKEKASTGVVVVEMA